ncbi:MAG: hypothetical protein GY940_40700 [bacterium]|nr:hypothetical protein [bacterium]
MSITMVLLAFILMSMAPFLMAIKELKRPKDDGSLYIDMHHSKDPFYFGRAFQKLVEKKIAPNGFDRAQVNIKLSKMEPVEISSCKVIPNDTEINRLFYIKRDLSTGSRVIMNKDVYVKGAVRINKNNTLRAIYGEEDIRLDRDCRVVRWVCGEKNMTVAGGADLGRSATCEGRMELEPNCRFHALFAAPVSTSDGTIPENSHWPLKVRVPKKTAWKIIKKHVSISCNEEDVEKEQENQEENNLHWNVTQQRVTIEAGSEITSNFVARRELVIKENCQIQATVKAYGDVFIRKNSVIHGDIFAEGNIHISENCILMGNVFSQAGITIGNGVRISRPDSIKSVIGKRSVEIGKNTVIYGYVLTEGTGMTVQ